MGNDLADIRESPDRLISVRGFFLPGLLESNKEDDGDTDGKNPFVDDDPEPDRLGRVPGRPVVFAAWKWNGLR